MTKYHFARGLFLGAFICISIYFNTIRSQDDYIQGFIFEETKKGDFKAIPYANIYWRDTLVGTNSDSMGFFRIPHYHPMNFLVIKYVGYETDTIEITDHEELTIILKNSQQLDEIQVIYKKKSTEISFLKPMKIEVMGKEELCKAACCNLSESFETNPSVDVSYTDAVTGSKQIQMLGLSGKYVQLSRESMPYARGLISRDALNFIPGSWVESIQLSKGAGSAINGFESMTGQINVDIKKPENSENLYVNMYANQEGRIELNINSKVRFNDNLSSGILLHTSDRFRRVDNNQDGFMDVTIGPQYNLINRWKFNNNKGLMAQLGVHLLTDEKIAGVMDYDAEDHKLSNTMFGSNIFSKREEVWGKMGYIFPNNKYKSIGVQFSFNHFNKHAIIGQKQYYGDQRSIYGNMIYQTIIVNTNHKLKTGLSYMSDIYTDSLEYIIDSISSYRKDTWPGSFVEYTFTGMDKLTFLTSLRLDRDAFYGNIVSPRLHIKYGPSTNLTIRFSGGRGMRSIQAIAELLPTLFSSRRLYFVHSGEVTGEANFSRPELAWNLGGSISYRFELGSNKRTTMSLDVYRTKFDNQFVVDLDKDSDKIYLYSVQGSHSNSMQFQTDATLSNSLDVRLAYRWYDVKQVYLHTTREAPLMSKHRAFINTAFKPNDKWAMDATLNWVGPKRIPNNIDYSPSYITANFQLTKEFGKVLDVYVGCENLTNFRQAAPILGSENPFGNDFDANLVWGPIFGRMLYAGFRFEIQ